MEQFYTLCSSVLYLHSLQIHVISDGFSTDVDGRRKMYVRCRPLKCDVIIIFLNVLCHLVAIFGTDWQQQLLLIFGTACIA